MSAGSGNVPGSAIAPPPHDETGFYNVYKVYFAHTTEQSHEAIALVGTEQSDQGYGRFYHLNGSLELSMAYQSHHLMDFSILRRYQCREFLFEMPEAFLIDFENIAENRSLSHNRRAVTDTHSNTFVHVHDCLAWTEEVLAALRALLAQHGIDTHSN
ncbi:MAG: hypothetical protein M1837_005912 [Sclerophora amabilis]|nr:MAG: hypothetical protein M1837_005912 [Sclerophora amabilis]